MGWKEEVSDVFENIDAMTQDMDAPSAKHLAVFGLAISGYVAVTLPYFAYKGGKLITKAIQNHH